MVVEADPVADDTCCVLEAVNDITVDMLSATFAYSDGIPSKMIVNSRNASLIEFVQQRPTETLNVQK